jgi:hypothetical protein
MLGISVAAEPLLAWIYVNNSAFCLSVHLKVLYYSQNVQRLFPRTALEAFYLCNGNAVGFL